MVKEVDIGDGKALATECAAAVAHLRRAAAEGTTWRVALVEAMALWPLGEEVYRERRLTYLLEGEAFDWVALAERLCEEADGLVPLEERDSLLRGCLLPLVMGEAEFRRLLGPVKSHAYLNFFYGVTVEGALQRAVGEEVAKERFSRSLKGKADRAEEVYARIYDLPRRALLELFRGQKGHPQSGLLSEPEEKSFTYWLFKRRFATGEPARVASDTRKGLEQLQREQGEALSQLR